MSNKTDKENKEAQKFINKCVNVCKKAGMKTQKQVYEWLLAELMESYKDEAPKWKLEWIAEDFTESICIKMNIPQTGVR